MSRTALIIYGGWDGHQPGEVAAHFKQILHRSGFEVELSESLDSLLDMKRLASLSLLVPVWTMGKITDAQQDNVCRAVEAGLGVGGCHGGMCDAFREATQWQFMTGGQWVAHPGNDRVAHMINIGPKPDPITAGISDFAVKTEQYYMHVDPAIHVLATSRFPTADGPHAANGPVDMPVVWTKRYGDGRVFYNSLGHQADVVKMPEVTLLMQRGFNWAARNTTV